VHGVEEPGRLAGSDPRPEEKAQAFCPISIATHLRSDPDFSFAACCSAAGLSAFASRVLDIIGSEAKKATNAVNGCCCHATHATPRRPVSRVRKRQKKKQSSSNSSSTRAATPDDAIDRAARQPTLPLCLLPITPNPTTPKPASRALLETIPPAIAVLICNTNPQSMKY
jgi:hypothetical protein